MTTRAARWALAAFCVLTLVLLALPLGLSVEPAPEAAGHRAPFTIVALPDTQLYAESFPETFYKQTEWIKANKERLNIVCVVHEGDITNNNTEPQWAVADKALSALDGVVPYCLVPGNHDTGAARETALLDEHFPPSRFEGKPWYGGTFEEKTIKNAYYTFEAAGMRFLVVCLEFEPRDEVLEWANKLVAEHPDHKVIVVTHCYMNCDDTRIGREPGGNAGEDMWAKFVSKHENIVLVLSGHVCGDGAGRLTSEGEHGNTVHQLLADYQWMENGGNGWLRVLTFIPDENKIVVTTYSPLLDSTMKDDQNAFELELKME